MNIQKSNYIKLIAMLTMLIDHIGAILFPNQIIFRIIGRIALPLFAYQLGVGYDNTKNVRKYILRLLVFGICIQLLYLISIHYFGINARANYLNIFFTLSLGLMAIYFYDNGRLIYLFITLIVPMIFQYFGFTIDYGTYGIALILIMYIQKNRIDYMTVAVAVLSLLYSYIIQGGYYTQMYCLAAIIFIIKPLNLKLHMPKYVFYLFYPVHLAILYIIAEAIKK